MNRNKFITGYIVLKKRQPKRLFEQMRNAIYPKIGWSRWFRLLRHRVKRLPDTPHRIALGLSIGVAVTFTPLFGLHFLTAAIICLLFRANIVASIIATFVGNPLTFPIFAVICYNIGAWIFGIARDGPVWPIARDGFATAWNELSANFLWLFGGEHVGWSGFSQFMWNVFIPYTVGGLVPATILGIIIYFGTKPLIARYQNRRRGVMAQKLQEWRNRLREARLKEASEQTHQEMPDAQSEGTPEITDNEIDERPPS